MKKVASVDDYLRSVPKDMRTALNKLRKTIKAAAPDAEEVISYNMPAFRQNGILVYYAAFKEHCSLFPGSAQIRRQFSTELKPFDTGKGTLHFTPDHPLPTDLVTRIVEARVAENATRRSKRAPSSQIAQNQALNRDLSGTTNARLDDVKENANDPIIPRIPDSPISRPVNRYSPILPARQKTTPEQTTGYGRGDLRRERD